MVTVHDWVSRQLWGDDWNGDTCICNYDYNDDGGKSGRYSSEGVSKQLLT